MKTILKQLFFSLLLITAVSCSKDGVDGVDGQDGTDGVDGQNASGLTYVYLTGDITDAEAATKLQNDVGSTTQFIYVQNTTQLTSLDLSGVTDLVSLIIVNNEALTTLNIPDLVTLDQYFLFNGNPLVTSLNLPSLESVENMQIAGSASSNSTSLQQIDISALTYAFTLSLQDANINTLTLNSDLQVNTDLSIGGNPNLTALDLSSLTSVSGYLSLYSNPSLVSIDLSILNTVGNIEISNNAVLTAIDLSVFTMVEGRLTINYNALLTTVNLPQLTSLDECYIGGNINLDEINMPLLNAFYSIYFINDNLDSTDVNSFLNQLVSITPAITSKYIQLNGQQTPAPPTGQGVTDYNTLVANGNTVQTD